MKLLIDANLSHHLVEMVGTIFPDSTHVRDHSLQRGQDSDIWEFARSNDFTIVTKDIDFHERSLVEGSPPKIIWIRRGNCSTTVIAKLLQSHADQIKHFHTDPENSCFILF